MTLIKDNNYGNNLNSEFHYVQHLLSEPALNELVWVCHIPFSRENKYCSILN